ncbi:MAG: PucR family transcriptional regulator [Solirubrobacterales bacterium]
MSPPPSHISSLIQRLVASLRDRTGEITEATIRRVRHELTDYYVVASPDWQAAGHGALPKVLSATWATLENDGRCPEHLPSALVEEALNAARAGVAWEVVDRSYAMTHEAIWDVILDEVSSWQLSRTDQQLALRTTSRYLFRCFDWLTAKAGEIYVGERDQWLDQRQKQLLEIVSQAIDGVAVTDAVLGYGTEQQHLGVVGWGRDPQRAIAEGARILGGELLSVPSDGTAVWAWIGRASFPDYDRCLDAFTPAPGTHLALGAIVAGRKGFTYTHRQAQLASWVAVRQLAPSPRGVTAYPEVSVETFALGDESGARMFVSHVLGPLAAEGVKMERLRQTLRAYCDAGQNSALAADRLGVAERTVRYRLRTIESELGGRTRPHSWLEPWLAVRILEALHRQADSRMTAALESPDGSMSKEAAR